MSIERRRCTRIPFNNDCIFFTGEQAYETRLIDISIKGALIELTNALPSHLETSCDLRIALEGGAAEIKLHCRVAHRAQRHVGLYFTVTDVESLTHLRRLISLNSGDAERTLEELSLWSTDRKGAKDEPALPDSDPAE